MYASTGAFDVYENDRILWQQLPFKQRQQNVDYKPLYTRINVGASERIINNKFATPIARQLRVAVCTG